jgi:hypothetical protein
MAVSGSVRVILARKYLDGKEAVRRMVEGEILLTDCGRRVYFNDNYFLSDGTLFECTKIPEVYRGPFNNFMDLHREKGRDEE